MPEVGRELQVIKMAQAEAIEVEKPSFQCELEKVREKIKLVESISVAFEEELRLLKASKVTRGERPAKSTSTAKKFLIVNENELEGVEGIR